MCVGQILIRSMAQLWRHLFARFTQWRVNRTHQAWINTLLAVQSEAGPASTMETL